MSAFLCGVFRFKRIESRDFQVGFGWRIIRLGVSSNLHFQLGCNIVQDVVFEILKIPRPFQDSALLPFLITDSPLTDTSDAVISPSELHSKDDRVRIIRQNFERISSVFAEALTTQELGNIEVILSEGYDTEYPEKRIPITTFVETCISLLEGEWEVPSIRLIIGSGKSGPC